MDQIEASAYQYDSAGYFTGTTTADPSPLEEGVWLVPAGATLTPTPKEVPPGMWPRWNGASWMIVNKPLPPEPEDPVAKLKAFLASNPDVAELLK